MSRTEGALHDRGRMYGINTDFAWSRNNVSIMACL